MELTGDLYKRILANRGDWLRARGCTVFMQPTAKTAAVTNGSNPDFNALFAINCEDGSEAKLLIEDRIRRITALGRQPVIWLDAFCRPTNLAEILAEMGFTLTSTSYILWTNPGDIRVRTGSDLEMGQVVGGLSLLSWAETYCDAFGKENKPFEIRRWRIAMERYGSTRSSNLQFLLATLDDNPVTTAQLITTHGVGGLYSVGTLPNHRGRGFASALITRIAMMASRRGLSIVYLVVTTRENKELFQNLGFGEVLPVQIWEQA